VDQITEAQGFKMPTRRRIRGPEMKPVRDLLMVAIDLSDFSFS
jgi:hypothetical protein